MLSRALFLSSTLISSTAVAGGLETPLTTIRVASGLSRPVFVTAAEGDFDRAFIVEQRTGTTGRIRILNLPSNTLNATAYLSISPVATGNEQGFLGLALHPDFLNNGYFWVNYNNAAGTTIIARYQANAPFATSTTANAASATTVLSISQPFTNHNGGWIGFGPDGYLYIATGDGGSANDPGNRAQDTTAQLLGKLLRLDVDGADDIPGNDDDDGVIGMTLAPYTNPPDNPFVGVSGDDELWAYGLRNPWRCSFDRMTGDLYIGDVGQNAWEEIDFQPASDPGGRNYGWRCMEGLTCTGLTGCVCNGPTLTKPVHVYSHGEGCSVTGGVVYRGAIPDLQGTYFFSDFCSSTLWTFRLVGGAVTEFMDRTTELAPGGGLSISGVSSFGEDAAGEAYICDLNGGEVFKIVPESCPGDLDGNGARDLTDLSIALSNFGTPGGATPEDGDLDGDGDVDLTDIALFLSVFAVPCP